MQRADSMEKTPMLGKIKDRRRGWQRMRLLESITDLMNMNWTKLQEIMKDRKPSVLQSMGVTKSWTWFINWTTKFYSVDQKLKIMALISPSLSIPTLSFSLVYQLFPQFGGTFAGLFFFLFMSRWCLYVNAEQAHEAYQTKNRTLELSTDTCCSRVSLFKEGLKIPSESDHEFHVLLDPHLPHTPHTSVINSSYLCLWNANSHFPPCQLQSTPAWVTVTSCLDSALRWVSFPTCSDSFPILGRSFHFSARNNPVGEKIKTTSLCFPSEIWISEMKFKVYTKACINKTFNTLSHSPCPQCSDPPPLPSSLFSSLSVYPFCSSHQHAWTTGILPLLLPPLECS